MLIKIRNRNYKFYDLEMEPNDSIEKLRLKIADRDGEKSDSFSLMFNSKMLEDNKTLADYNIHEGSFIFVGFLYKINFYGVIYKKGGIGCGCCGGRGDLFGFLSSKTGIPRNELYLVNGKEKIRDKDFDIEEYYFEEYIFKTHDPNKIIKIICEDKQFFVYRPKKIDYNILYESIAKGYYRSVLDIPDNDNDDEKFKSVKQNLLMKYDLVFNGKIIDKNEDLRKIENLKEIALVEKKSNEDKKE